jgi:hypothetical protein
MPAFRKYSDNGTGYRKVRIEMEIMFEILITCIKRKVCKKQANDQSNTFCLYYQ